MPALSYAWVEILAYLLVFTILFAFIFFALLTGILLARGIRSCLLWVKHYLRPSSSALTRAKLSSAIAGRNNS
jgi:MFS superfamily sulfate permease-like transporter